jgi:hypothetical protein
MERNMYQRVIVIGVIFLIGVGCLMVFAQKRNDTKSKESKPIQQTPNSQENSLTFFSKMSSIKEPADLGFNIQEVRRINVWTDAPRDNNSLNRMKSELVKIVLEVKFQPYNGMNNTDSLFMVQIGDRNFEYSHDTTSNKMNLLYVLISAKEFQELKDNSFVTLAVTSFQPLDLKNLYKNGEPKEVYGAKFGRLDKKMIDKFPVIEINAP